LPTLIKILKQKKPMATNGFSEFFDNPLWFYEGFVSQWFLDITSTAPPETLASLF
jgi:hypothetical protein